MRTTLWLAPIRCADDPCEDGQIARGLQCDMPIRAGGRLNLSLQENGYPCADVDSDAVFLCIARIEGAVEAGAVSGYVMTAELESLIANLTALCARARAIGILRGASR